ncbi:PP2C family protein-serine/threonine phosphatase [Streptomyces avicenniae]|uniref:PP2C family protein-serine/threonine phosphatase n=1 Tax=Streptomyces avicenniae TaxID=500153 RepID=UPI000AB5F3C6|nr:PP2C family protein-serine/threonine phosphatase [Streptomyces avicenniae]
MNIPGRDRLGSAPSGPLPGLPLPRWLRYLPIVLLAAGAVGQALAPNWVQLVFLFAALPPLSGLVYSPWQTAALGVAALVLITLPVTRPPHISDGDVVAVGAIVLFSVLVSWIRSRYTRDLVLVRDVAEAAQRAVLPPLPEHVGPVTCRGLYRPAQVGTLVGGDLFDVREGPYGVRALVGDVRGHGLAAVGTVAAILGAFREAVLDEPELQGVAARLDRRLRVDAESGLGREESEVEAGTELFATALLIEYAPQGGEVRIVQCGHPPPLLVRDGEVCEVDVESAPPLGLGSEVPTGPAVASVSLRAGDVLFGYTDGVTEARNGAGTFYPLEDRLRRLLGGRASPPGGVIDLVWRDLTGFADALQDDVAMLALGFSAPWRPAETGPVRT